LFRTMQAVVMGCVCQSWIKKLLTYLLMESTALVRRTVWNLKPQLKHSFITSFVLQNFMQKLADFLQNCWTVLCIMFYYLYQQPFKAVIDNVVIKGLVLSGQSHVYTRTQVLHTIWCGVKHCMEIIIKTYSSFM